MQAGRHLIHYPIHTRTGQRLYSAIHVLLAIARPATTSIGNCIGYEMVSGKALLFTASTLHKMLAFGKPMVKQCPADLLANISEDL